MSRSQAQEAIAAGRVRVNGLRVRDPQVWVDLERDRVELDDAPLQAKALIYFAFHKPGRQGTVPCAPGGRGVVEADEEDAALARAGDGGLEEAVGAVGDGGRHGLADDLGDEHAGAEGAGAVEFDPGPVALFEELWVAEAPGGGFEGQERDAGAVGGLGSGGDDPERGARLGRRVGGSRSA
jgi:hypothetical protein